MKPDLSIITLTKDRWDLLEACGQQLSKAHEDMRIQWVVMDNGEDGSWLKAQDTFDGPNREVTAVRHDNTGSFSSMNNRAVTYARSDNLLFLNNDVRVMTQLCMVTAFLEHESVGTLGAVLQYPDGGLQHAGVIMQENAAPANLGIRAIKKLGLNPDRVHPMKWPSDAIPFAAVTGAFLACRKASFEAVGGFDESFPWGFEDVDLCLRMADELELNSYVSRFNVGIHIESATGTRDHAVDAGLHAFRGRWGHRAWADFQRFQGPALSPKTPPAGPPPS